METVTLGTPEPDRSVTVPERVAPDTCARTGTETSIESKTSAATALNFANIMTPLMTPACRFLTDNRSIADVGCIDCFDGNQDTKLYDRRMSLTNQIVKNNYYDSQVPLDLIRIRILQVPFTFREASDASELTIRYLKLSVAGRIKSAKERR